MKKLNIIILASALLAGGVTTSCNLDREPQQSLDLSRALLTVNDAEAWQAGLKARLRTSVGGDFYIPQDIQADELNATLDYGNIYGSFANWDLFQSGEYATSERWTANYTTIKNANYVIEYLPKLLADGNSLSDSDKAKLKAILGEAYFMRANAYLSLALRFGKAYTSATADTELSVPIHLKYDFLAKPPRSTNKEVYAQVLSDLETAATNLSDVAGAANSDAITLDAVKALQARTHLYMENWAEALKVSSELTASSTYALMEPSADNMTAMWQSDGILLKEAILQPNVSYPDEANLDLGSYLMPKASSSTFSPTYLPTQSVYDLYSSDDTRKGVYFWAGETLALDGKTYTDLVMVGKFRGNKALDGTAHPRWGIVPNGRMRPKVLRIAEQYLIAAEAAYHTGGDALTPLNALRQSRGLSALSGVSGAELLKEIKLERQRELAFEGFRLFDLKRWGEGVVRGTPQSSTQADSPLVESLTKMSYPAGHNKFVWPIPYLDVSVGGLVQNPGY